LAGRRARARRSNGGDQLGDADQGVEGQEVDLLLQLRGALLPIEIKLGVAVPDLQGLQTCMRDLGLTQGYVVNLSSEPVDIRRGIWMGGLHHLLARLDLRPRPPTAGVAPGGGV
jgi:hypothetical protein